MIVIILSLLYSGAATSGSHVTNTTCGVQNLDACVIKVPEAQGWSGGACLASMAEAGWVRSPVINHIVGAILNIEWNKENKRFPLITGTNSGGSMFGTRYFTLREHRNAVNWNYPCYLLHNPYSSVCFFHNKFGTVGRECDAEIFNVVIAATQTAYKNVMNSYGGPSGVVATYCFVYHPFISDLPITAGERTWWAFIRRYMEFSTQFGVNGNWAVAHTLVSPQAAQSNIYNYGLNSWLSRSVNAYRGKAASTLQNITVAWVVAASANTQSGFALFPFALAGKSWDGLAAASDGSAKLFSMILSYVTTKKLILAHSIMDVNDFIPGACNGGCPLLDGGFTDNGPITPILAGSLRMAPVNRPTWVVSVGAASNMENVKYLMGTGPFDIYNMGAINYCPVEVQICEMMDKVKKLQVDTMSKQDTTEYYAIQNAFGVYRPEVKALSPYCGDPLNYDMFEKTCEADAVCDMWASVVPSRINDIAFTPDVYVVVFVMVYLHATPVSSRFVRLYMPQDMWDIQYYEHMDDWFPNFDAVAPQKGGTAFTKIAGNAFMDYMTYLAMRMSSYLSGTKSNAKSIKDGEQLACHYQDYRAISGMTSSSDDFFRAQAAR